MYSLLLSIGVAFVSVSAEAATSSGQDECPLGWAFGGELGCYLFMPEQARVTWLEALELCEIEVMSVFPSNFFFRGVSWLSQKRLSKFTS